MDNKRIQKFKKVRVTISVTRDIDYIVNVANPSDLAEVKAAMRNKDAADWEHDPQFYEHLGDSCREAVDKISSENIGQIDQCQEVVWDLKIIKTCPEQRRANTPFSNQIDRWLGEVAIEYIDTLHVLRFRLSHLYNKTLVKILSDKPKELTDAQWQDLGNTLTTFIGEDFANNKWKR